MQQRNHVLIAFLMGVVITLGAALLLQSGSALPKAHAQAAAGGQGLFMVTGTGFQGQSRDVLFLVDPQSSRLAVYEYKNGRLALQAIRNLEYELRFQTWNPRGKDQEPTVKDMKDLSEEVEENRRGRR